MIKSKTKAEKAHLSSVAALGCIICRNIGYPDSPAELHHIRSGQGLKRASHFEVIPLCPTHHRTGTHGIAIHAGRSAWESIFGTEFSLLKQVESLL